jgi:hypothetical protein
MAISQFDVTQGKATIKYDAVIKTVVDAISGTLQNNITGILKTKDENNNSDDRDIKPFDLNTAKQLLYVNKLKVNESPLEKTVNLSVIDALITVIVDNVYEKLVNEIEISMKTRMDKLEDDYNLMLVAMSTAGAGMSAPPLTPVGAAFTAIAMAGGNTVATSRLVTTTTPAKLNELTQLK